jgi:hypothetical protein
MSFARHGVEIVDRFVRLGGAFPPALEKRIIVAFVIGEREKQDAAREGPQIP